MSVAPAVWLPETVANSSAQTGNQNQAGIIQCADGSFWVTWREFVDSGPAIGLGVDIIGQHYDVLGQPIGGAQLLNPSGYINNDERDPAYAADLSGSGFYMAFESADIADSAHVDIVLTRLNEDGLALSTLVIASDPTGDGLPNNLRNPDVAMISAGNGLVVWERTNEAGDTDIRGCFFDPGTNTVLWSAFTIANSTDNKTEPQVVALANGTYAVIWVDEFNGSATQHDISYQIVGSGGANLASGTITPGSGNEAIGSVLALSGGGFVISWTDQAAENGNVLWARFDDLGVQQGATQTVAAGANAQGDNHLFATDDGGFGVVWEDETAGRISTRVYAADGTPQSGTVHLDEEAATSPLESLMLGDGRILLAYAQFDPVGLSNDPHFMMIDPRAAANAVPAYPGDYFIGTTGAETLSGGLGFRRIYGADGDDVLEDTSTVSETLDGGAGNDRISIVGTDSGDYADGGTGTDTLVLDGLIGTSFTMDFAAGAIANGPFTMVRNFEAFEYAGPANATVVDNSAALSITTGTGADTITLVGGADTVSTGDGDDTLAFTGTTMATGIVADLGAGLNVFALTGYTGTAAFYLSTDQGIHGAGGFGDVVISTVTGVVNFLGGNTGRADHVSGDTADNLFDGGGGNDELLGQGGADTLTGGLGNDTLDGGTGVDSLTGGLGNDLYIVNQQADVVDETGGDGVDTVQSSVSWTLTSAFENLTLTGAAIQASGNPLGNVLTGNDGDNVFYAGGGNDTLHGGGGNDRLAGSTGIDSLDGGEGDDIFFLDDAGEVSQLSDSGGIDELRSAVVDQLPDFIERLRIQGTLLTGYGNDLDNDLIGNGLGNTLWGQAGNDKLYGYGGEDTLRGEEGDDTLYGGGAVDALYGGIDNDLLRSDEGDDDLFGEGGDDNLGGGDGNDALDGGAGRDIMQGNAGIDRYYFHEGDFAGITNATADKITDFVPGEDHIYIFIDAVQGGLDDDFTWIGTAAFSGTAGELRYGQSGGITLVEGDTTGDGVADIAIALTGNLTLSAADFTM